MSMYLFSLWGVIFAILGLTTLFAVWSRRDTWVRGACLAIFLFGFPIVPAVYVETLGMHKPFKLAWDLPSGEGRVIGSKMVVNKGIYLYIDTGRPDPWPIELPWDNEMANRIQKLIDEAAPDANGQFIMRYEPSLDVHAPQFHPLPQPPALPPKPQQSPAPHLEGA